MDSEVQAFFKDQTVFLTGATGFLGKVLLEKLLRACEIQKVYVLIRPKKGKDAQKRFEELFEFACFDWLKSQRPDVFKKVHLVTGDCSEKNLGLDDVASIEAEVTIVLHTAGSTSFSASLKTAMHYNFKAIQEVLAITRRMVHLKAFVHISTAYLNYSPSFLIEEKIYDPPMMMDRLLFLLDTLDDSLLAKITPEILGAWPNTYVYSKAFAESFLRNEAGDIPVAIVRPSMVGSTLVEPMPGWYDNFGGMNGVLSGIVTGVLRSILMDLDVVTNIVPCDYVASQILAAAWNRSRTSGDIHVYNMTGSAANPITIGEALRYTRQLLWKFPTLKLMWYPWCIFTKNPKLYAINCFLLHTLVAYFLDALLFCVGKQPRAVKMYKKIDKLVSFTMPYHTKNFNFQTDNVTSLWQDLNETDRELFNFDMASVDWKKYSEVALMGGRTYVLKDSPETIPAAKRKLFCFMVIHYVVLVLLTFVFLKMLKIILFL